MCRVNGSLRRRPRNVTSFPSAAIVHSSRCSSTKHHSEVSILLLVTRRGRTCSHNDDCTSGGNHRSKYASADSLHSGHATTATATATSAATATCKPNGSATATAIYSYSYSYCCCCDYYDQGFASLVALWRWSSTTSALMARRMSEGRPSPDSTEPGPTRIVCAAEACKGRKQRPTALPFVDTRCHGGKKLLHGLLLEFRACGYKQNSPSCNAMDSLSGV